MARTYRDVLRDQGRGIAGALFVVGLSSLYTMESWWIGWQLPLWSLIGYAVVGLLGVLVITRRIGFQEEAEDRTRRSPRKIAADFAELVLQSFLTAYLVLLVFGVLDAGQSLITVVRLGLIQVVPLGFGAAVANRLLSSTDAEIEEATFPRNVPTYLLGAVFVTFPVAPTDEVRVIAAHAGWVQLAGIVGMSVVIVYLVLYELEFRGQRSRRESRPRYAQVGSAFLVYTIGVVVAVAFLVAFGQFAGTTVTEWVQQTIVLAFVASTGASASEVVL